MYCCFVFFFSSRQRHTRGALVTGSSDVCSSDLIVIGGVAGYYGGFIDALTLRTIEIIKSFPELPLFMTLSALLPVTWSPIGVFVGISVIIGLLDWTGLARSVRAKFLSLREEDFTTAAQLLGAPPARIIGRHLLPSFTERK